MADELLQWTKKWVQQTNFQADFFEETSSTIDRAKEQYSEIEEPHVFLAGKQSSGRGRGSHRWENPGRWKGLLSTWCFPLPSPPQPISTPLFGLAVYRAAMATWPAVAWGLKAPNDLYIGKKKVGGVLLEGVTEGEKQVLLISLGLNVLASPETVEEAGSLIEATDVTEKSWFQFLDALLVEFSHALGQCTETHLSSTACTELTEALNRCPAMDYKVLSVEGNGSLKTENDYIRWIDL